MQEEQQTVNSESETSERFKSPMPSAAELLSEKRRIAGRKGGANSSSRPFRDKPGLARKAVLKRWKLYHKLHPKPKKKLSKRSRRKQRQVSV